MLKRDCTCLRVSSYAILFLLTGAALYLRWSYATSASPFIDEFKTLWNATNIATGLASPFAWGPGADAPLFRDLEVVILQLFGFTAIVARTPSIVISVATVPVMFYVGRRMFSIPAGLLACALMAFAPEAVIWGARAREYPLFLLLTLLSTWLFYRWMIEPDDAVQISRERGLLFVVCFAVALFTHLEAILLLPGFALSALVRHGPSVLTRWWVLVSFLLCGAGVLVVLVLFLQSEKIPGAIPLGATLWAGTAQFSLGVKNLGVFSKFFKRTPGGFVLLPIALSGLAYSMARLLRRKVRARASSSEEFVEVAGQAHLVPAADLARQNHGLVFLSVALLWGAGAIIFLLGPRWGSETRYILFLLPMFSLVVGATAVRFLSFLVERAGIRSEAMQQWAVSGLVMVGVGLIGVSSTVSEQRFRQEWGYDLAFEYAADQWREGDVMVTVAPVACLASVERCDYFAIQKAYETYAIEKNGRLVETVSGLPLVMTVQEMEEVLDRHEGVWFVTDEGRFLSRYDSEFTQLVWDRMELVSNERGALVFRSLQWREPLIWHEMDISLEEKFRLRGWDLNGKTFSPGDKLELTSYWQGVEYAQYFGLDYSVFLHLVNRENGLLAQSDGYPVRGLYPTSHWRSTEVVIPDRRSITLPADVPSGRYRLELGMYLLSTGDRLQVWDESGSPTGEKIILDYIEVGEGYDDHLTPTTPLQVNLGDEAMLSGYDLVPAAVDSGGSMVLTLYWQALGKIERDYTVFVHLVAEDGEIISQHDGQPEGGFYPTSYWYEGEVVRDEHVLSVPGETRAGEYELRVGMYLSEDMARLPALGGGADGDWVVLTRVLVGGG